MEPNTPIYLQGNLVIFLNLPLHLEVQILGKVWKDGEHFHEIAVHKGNARFKVNLKLMNWIYSQHRIENFLVNKVGYDCCHGRQFTSTKARCTCGPFDSFQNLWNLWLNMLILLISQIYAQMGGKCPQ